MNVAKTGANTVSAEMPRLTKEELQKEYDYILAQELTRELLEVGLIDQEEFEEITEQNRRSFMPLLYRIMKGPGLIAEAS